MKDSSQENQKEEQTSLNGDSQVFPEDGNLKKMFRENRWYHHIPYWVKALFIKYWFFGLNYFLFQIGLGYLIKDMTAYNSMVLMLIQGVAQGIINDIFIYNILETVEDFPGESFWWVIFKKHKLYSLFINVAYGMVWGYLSWRSNGLLASNIIKAWPQSWFFQEPFSWAVIAFIIDGAFILIKDAIYHLVTKGKKPETDREDD